MIDTNNGAAGQTASGTRGGASPLAPHDTSYREVLGQIDTPAQSAPVDRLLNILDRLGTPIFTARLGGREFIPPRGWQHLDATDNRERLEAWRPGMALCARLAPATFGVVDIDLKNGASLDDAKRFVTMTGATWWAQIRTPSGGWHLYLPGDPAAKDYPADRDRHFPGLPGVEFYGRRHFVYLPGTCRPKYDGAGYQIVRGDESKLTGSSAPLWSVLARLDAARRQTVPPSAPRRPVSLVAPPAGQGGGRAERFTSTVLHGEADKLAGTSEGGRNVACYLAALKLGSRTLLTLDEASAALEDACRTNGLLDEDGAQSVRQTIRSGFETGRRDPRPTPANTPTIDERRTA